MVKIQINPRKKLFYWGPVDGKPVFPEYWNLGLHYFSEDYKPGWPDNIMYFEKEKLFFVCEYGKLYDQGETVFKKYVLNKTRFKNSHKRWQIFLKDFELIDEKIKNTDLALLSNEDLRTLFQEFNKIYSINFWRHSMLPEVANWGGEQLLTRELRKKLGSEKDFVFAMERLTSPEDFSFYQIEELELLAIKLEKSEKKRKERLITHQQKYFWMLNSYHHTKILPVAYFEKALAKISAQQAKRKIKKIKSLKQTAAKHKLEVVKKYYLPKNILSIGRSLAFCIWWQDIRKAYIFRANYLIDLFVKELARRYKIKHEDLYLYTVMDLENLVKGQALDKDEIRRRKESFLIYLKPAKKETILISGKPAKEIFRQYGRNENVGKDIKEFKGLVVNRGLVRGKAKILFSPRDVGKMKKGDILVTSMTTPDFIVALKKAMAVVTDEGGMTCHAAIVSRELKIPGIVATKFATKVLKDGDLVEVDANKGLVKIIERK